MSPVGAIFGPSPPKTRSNLLHARPPSIVERVKVEVWFQLECAPEQLVSVVTANRHFYVATCFLWYPNLIICYLNL